MKLRSKRTILGACALGLTLLSGCVLVPGEPEAPPPVDPPPPPPPVDPPPVDPPPVDPPPPPPPPLANNGPADEYDPAHHRILVPDCDDSALLSLDLTTGERSVFIDDWAWSEPDSTTCVEEISVRPDGAIAYARVFHAFPNPDGAGGHCSARDFIAIDTATGDFMLLGDTQYSNCDGGGGSEYDHATQIDQRNQRFLSIHDDCSADWCDHYLHAKPFDGGPIESVTKLNPTPPCYPDDEGCTNRSRYHPLTMVFDPLDPNNRVLVFAYDVMNMDEPFFEVRDIATGEILETFFLQTIWGDFEASRVRDVAVDIEGGRVLVTLQRVLDYESAWPVIAIDRHTGDQTLVHDGNPTAAEPVFPWTCQPNAAYDTRTGRLVLVGETGGYFECPGDDFALDLATGELSPL